MKSTEEFEKSVYELVKIKKARKKKTRYIMTCFTVTFCICIFSVLGLFFGQNRGVIYEGEGAQNDTNNSYQEFSDDCDTSAPQQVQSGEKTNPNENKSDGNSKIWYKYYTENKQECITAYNKIFGKDSVKEIFSYGYEESLKNPDSYNFIFTFKDGLQQKIQISKELFESLEVIK